MDGNAKSFWDVLKEPQMIISLWITGQFFVLVMVFSFWPSQMANEAKTVILQTYIVAFTAAWGYWLGSSSGSKSKDALRGAPDETRQTTAAPK